jgi:transposase InsO family protein
VAGADFFTIEVLSWRGLVRYSVFFVIKLRTRRVEISGISCQPNGDWMKQLARNLTDAVDGFLVHTRYLILDRDPLYTRAFRQMLKDSHVSVLRLPARSPNLNAHAERFVLSIKSECLDRLVLLSERHLRTAVAEYVEHYHRERHHQGLGGQLVEAGATGGADPGRVVCSERLGGMLKHYYREAA